MRYLIAGLTLLVLSACATRDTGPDTVVLSVIGTNDVHGELNAQQVGGLLTFSGYIAALRDRRKTDGAVLLLDGGDMWQGTLESNLNEGAAVVSVYNAMGYDAAAIGNHEFDFGPVGDAAIPETDADDPRGTLRARAREAAFPLLAANIIDRESGSPVDWDNVYPRVLIERAGIKIGVVGLTTSETLETTISANTVGLDIAPLASTVQRHARALRDSGAELVFVVAHAGGGCREYNDPQDLDSCDNDDEIFAVARALPKGLVDHIVAGHHHQFIAHEVNGIAITSNPSAARSFGRVDFEFDRVTRRVVRRTIYPPTNVCQFVVAGRQACAGATEQGASRAVYEGLPVQASDEVADLVKVALARSAKVKSSPLGVSLDRPITRNNEPYSAIGRLMTDAIREATGADMAIHNVVGGIRADLPQGPLTFGDVYRAFPFDNRVSRLTLSVAQIKTMLAHQVHVTDRRVGISGVHAQASCSDGILTMRLTLRDGTVLNDDETLTVIANDYLLLGGGDILTPITPAGGFVLDASEPRVRDVWVDWFKARGGSLNEADYLGDDALRWYLPDPLPTRADCRWPD